MIQNENNVPMVKRFVLLPACGDSKKYNLRIVDFLSNKISKLSNIGDSHLEDGDIQTSTAIAELEAELDRVKNGGKPSDKTIKDYTSNLVVQASASESERKSITLQRAYSIMVNRREELSLLSRLLNDEEKLELSRRFYRETHQIVSALFRDCSRILRLDPNTDDDTDRRLAEENILGGYGFDWVQPLKDEFWQLVHDGLLHGDVELPNFTSDLSFTTYKLSLGFSSDYATQAETLENWDDNINLYLCYGFNAYSKICEVNDGWAKFKIDVDSCEDKTDALDILKRIYSGEYRVGTSTIEIDDSHETIAVNLVVAPRSFKHVF